MDAGLKVFEYLEDEGHDVYFPNSHKGVVNAPIIVIYDMGQYSQFNNRFVGSTLIHLILHVPQDKYLDIIDLKEKVRKDMKCLKHLLKATGTETPTINDDIKKSYTLSIEYEVLKKL